MATFFTADTHFGHINIIKYSKRPFASVEEMDETIIERWNKIVKPSDDVWHLGDFNFRSVHPTEYYTDRLHGHLHIVWGNHDDAYAKKRHRAVERSATRRNLFASAHDVKYLHLHGEKITLYHYAQRVWRNSHHGAWHLFGHSHGCLPSHHRSMDVGVDCHNFTPLHFDQVRAFMQDKDVTLHHPELLTDPWDKGPARPEELEAEAHDYD